MKIFENISKKLKTILREDDSHEFKPILTEIEERPMNPLGQIIFWLIISFIVIGGLWMYLGKVDVVITARGIVIPDGEEKIIQSLDKGVVREIKVKVGDEVKAGEELAIITPAEYEPGLELNNLAEEEKILYVQLSSAQDKLSLSSKRKARLEEVLDIIPRTQYEQVVDEVTSYRHEINRINASLSEIRNKREQIEKQKQILTSPIDGYIGQVFVHTIGGVVTPAEKIMSVVPKDAKLQVKAIVSNQDIGFVKTGMPALIKIDTYNFQKYGILDGEVTIVSANSIQDDRMGPVYEIYVKPLNTTLTVEGKEEQMRIGMTTTNEIKIGKRRIIEFFVYPIVKYLDESIKVR